MQVEDIRRAVLATIESIAPATDMQRIRPDQPLRQQIDLDSMHWLNLIASLHDTLSIEIPESDRGQLATLDSLVAYAASRPAGHRAEPAPARAAAAAARPRTHHLVNGVAVTARPIQPEDMHRALPGPGRAGGPRTGDERDTVRVVRAL